MVLQYKPNNVQQQSGDARKGHVADADPATEFERFAKCGGLGRLVEFDQRHDDQHNPDQRC